MGVLGGTWMKVLAAAAALLAVPAGVPRGRCVCPAERVKLFCPGPSATGCCCDSPARPGSAEVEARCCEPGRGTTSSPPRPGNAQAVGGCGCHRGVSVDAVVSTAKEVDDRSWEAAEASVTLKVNTAAVGAAGLARAPRRFHLPPPDLVLLYCHFTC